MAPATPPWRDDWMGRLTIHLAIAFRLCPAAKAACSTDFAFINTPKPAFAERATKHGLVVVEAYVSPSGDVTSTKLLTNDTGDPNLASMAKSAKPAKFEAPKRGCVAGVFIFTYQRRF